MRVKSLLPSSFLSLTFLPSSSPTHLLFPPTFFSLPEGPGEKTYPKIAHPITGRPVSTKPANGAFLKHARWKAEQAALEERRAKGIPDDIVPSEPWTAWRFFKTLVLLLMGLSVVGKFITGSPVWGYEQVLAKVWKDSVWKVSSSLLLSLCLEVQEPGLDLLESSYIE